jgi:hypothetical protein
MSDTQEGPMQPPLPPPQPMPPSQPGATAERRRGVKRIVIGSRVVGSVGPLMPLDPNVVAANPNKRHRRTKERWTGMVLEAKGPHTWLVEFDNGQRKEVASNVLSVVSANASLPPPGFSPRRIRLPRMPGERSQPQGNNGDDEGADPDQDEEEDRLPGGEGDEEGEGEDQEGEGQGQEGQGQGQQQPERVLSYSQKLANARATIAQMAGQTVSVTSGRYEELTWTIVPESSPVATLDERPSIGLRGLELQRLAKDVIFAKMFLHLCFPDLDDKLRKFNEAHRLENDKGGGAMNEVIHEG